MANLTIRDVRKSYGAVEVMHGVSLEIEDGQFVVLVGPSGCGKSTLLRMIAGLEEISAGLIAIGDKVVNNLHPKDRDIAMVFQNYALYPHMKVQENMGFSLRLNGTPEAERKRKIDGAAGILGLQQLLERLPGNLSGGQRQRVAMGRAIVRNPEVFLFDEPLSNLDAKLRVAMRGEIKTLHQELRTTTVYVTHDQIEAMTMADRIVVMNAGRVEQVGAPLDLYDYPANTFVAGFIGSPAMNFLEGTLRPRGRDLFQTEDGVELPLPPDTPAGTDLPVTYGIRPEHVTVDPQGIPMTAQLVEPTGAEVHITGKVGAAPFVGVFRERVLPQPGEEVRFLPATEKVHLFDGATGRALLRDAVAA
ncbi:ABC transporter ATP-binding protein [Oceanicola granulosus HTCC2516]|uniref:ABC transporter ATP-binding protein n=1 Tax=Oceanicola granulosus (strain ATCC BAA-861 / DSM 15982 / KCTC 12143 / HTCC2516) TaxID=314256 RepID=Q2CHB9_OCEGH|nr:sn-glycerol-3-phosphate ABC transporter ATP-binding protein UgpC [Oceanicola granulosus]EAR52120.1 ABC transporter ATP-binding protein [Oceanicola granulosus HTCC2516]